jgi:site-specific DNA recombinase
MPSANGSHPERAILYAHVSTAEQARSGYSLAQQLEALREHAASEGYDVLEEVRDPGQSGASLERPGMDRVRDLVAAGGVSVVLAQDRDRFAREPAYHYLLRREFEEHGTKIRALNDRGDESPEGELTDGILDQLAKFERAKTAERTRRGRLRKAKQGKIVAATPRATYGFRFNATRDGYLVEEESMRVVQRILRMIGEECMTLRTVARTLERDGVSPPQRRQVVEHANRPRHRTRRLLQAAHLPGDGAISEPGSNGSPRPREELRRLLVQQAEGYKTPGARGRTRRAALPAG